VELEVDMLRVEVDTEVETEVNERVKGGSEGKERERRGEERESWQFSTPRKVRSTLTTTTTIKYCSTW